MKARRERKRRSKSTDFGAQEKKPKAAIASGQKDVEIARREAMRLSREAKQIRQQVDDLHGQGDKVHKSAKATHRSVKALRNQEKADQMAHPSPIPWERVDAVVAEEGASKGKSFPIVGLGASAGGFEAFVEFLKELPKETGMAFIFVQHLDPKHRSRLSDLLRHTSKLPVIDVPDDTEVKPDEV